MWPISAFALFVVLTAEKPQAAALAAATRRDANPDLAKDLQLDLHHRLAGHSRPSCATCHGDIEAGASVLLPECLHSACSRCLARAGEHGGALVCTLCGVAAPVDSSTAVRHPLVEATLASHKRHRCTECDDDATDDDAAASHRCADCAHYLCEPHAALHRKSRATKLHTLTAVAAAPTTQGSTCSVHRKPLDIYCTTCKTVVCYLCAFSAHPATSHKHQVLDERVCEQMRKCVNAAVLRAETAAKTRADRALDASITVKEVSDRSAALKTDIKAQIGALQAMLDARCDELMRKVDAIASEETDRVTAIDQAERVAHTVLMSTVSLARQLVEASTPAPALAQLEPHLCARLDALASAVPATPVPMPARVTFTVGAQLEEAIRKAGSLTIEP